jgi:hypothetical protein
MTTLTFSDVAKPVVTRKSNTENPYRAVVKDIAGATNGEGEPLAKAHTMTSVNVDEQVKDIARVHRQLAEAGKAAGVTVRSLIVPDASTLTTTVSFWTVKRITRPPKLAAVPAVVRKAKK